jgi:hypothetical protein
MALLAEWYVTDLWAAVCQPELLPMRHVLFKWFFINHQEQARLDPKALLTGAVHFPNKNKYAGEENNAL